jgi:hypothetical protein
MASSNGGTQHSNQVNQSKPRLVFWELTKGCNLRCIHCRANATELNSPSDLSTQAAHDIIDEIAAVSTPILVLSGGEALFRSDIFQLARYGTDKGLRSETAAAQAAHSVPETKQGPPSIGPTEMAMPGSTGIELKPHGIGHAVGHPGTHPSDMNAMTKGCLAGTAVCFHFTSGRGLSLWISASLGRRSEKTVVR